jgi:hypothetical protein
MKLAVCLPLYSGGSIKKLMKHPLCLMAILAVFYSGCVKAPPPNEPEKVSIISITPTSGPVGATVVIKGTHFADDPSDIIVNRKRKFINRYPKPKK